MKYYESCLISLLLFVFPGFSSAQIANLQDTLKLHHISSGLSQSSATQILEDKNGFLWIGTANGLDRYDGTSFLTFKKTSDEKIGLTDGYVESLYEDHIGNLLIGTKRGLSIFDPSLNIVKPFPFGKDSSFFRSMYIGTICRTQDLLWLGTAGRGVYKYNLQTDEYEQFLLEQIYTNGPSNRHVVSIFAISDNYLFLITKAKAYVISKNLEIISELPPQNISTAIKVDNRNYLLGSRTGDLILVEILDDFSQSYQKISVAPGKSVMSIAKDKTGNIWIGAENSGLSIHSLAQNRTLTIKTNIKNPNTIQSNSIWSLYCAQNGVMWLGSFKKGLSFYDPLYHKFINYKTNPFKKAWLNNDIINCFLEDDQQNIWIGTDGGGLNYWNRKTNTFEHRSKDLGNLNSNVVLTIIEDDRDRLWVGTWADGLMILDPKNQLEEVWNTDNSFLRSNNVISIIQDRKGRIWIATLFGGVHLHDPKSNTNRYIPINNSQNNIKVITAARMLEDSKGHIWIGSQTAGLFRLKEENNEFEVTQYESIRKKNKLSNDFVNTIYEDSHGTIWVGTQDGLNRYNDEQNSFDVYTFNEDNNAIKAIIEDEKGFLWLSASKGLIQFDAKTKTSNTFDVEDGLHGEEFNASSALKTRNNELLFGGNTGFNIFTIDQAIKRNDNPKLYFHSLKIFNQKVSPGDKFNVLAKDIRLVDSITFSHKHNVINFEFQALTYRHANRVNYAYYMEGFEADWKYVGNEASATYTNLSPGDYTLRVKSSNSDGVWLNNEISLFIRITPPYWATWWFKGSLIALVVIVLYSFYIARIRRIKGYQANLENLIDERTLELQKKQQELINTADELAEKNEEIQRFTIAVSHDLKSPLNTIKGFMEIIQHETKGVDPELDKYFHLVLSSCVTMSDLITDITKIAQLGKIENRKELLDANSIIDTAKELVTGRLQAKNAKLTVQKKLPPIFGDKNRMIQVFENLIDNAIKYMGDQPKPHVQVQLVKNDINNKFMITDNGSGLNSKALENLFSPFQRFDKSVEGTGLGLYMIQKIVESHDGHIHAESDGLGKGATFIVTLPKVRNIL